MSPKIEISSDLYVSLRTLMQPGDKTPSDVIWRLAEDHHAKRSDPPTTGWIIGRDEGLSSGGTVIPNGLRLRMKYKRGEYTYADVRDGAVWIGRRAFDSPSAAAVAVALANGAKGAAASLNGWIHWEFEMPRDSGRWRKLDTLRAAGQVAKRRRR
jgi:hypothetical protein